MATIISTKTSGVGGLEVTGDATGVLQLASNNGTTAVTVDASQNVGIGTASPTQKLQVYTSAGSGGQIQITNSSTGATSTDGVLIGYDGSNDVIFNNQEATQTKFYTSGTERMRIDSSGNLLVGATSAPSYTTQGFNFLVGGGSFGVVGHANGTANGQPYMVWAYNGTSIGYIGQNTTSSVSYNTTSDYRLKENIEPMVGALDKVLQLKPVTFTWKAGKELDSGFIAHELQSVLPNIVSGEKDAVNEDGSIKSQAVDYSKLTSTLTAAIQELKAIVDAQAERIAVLENKQ